jgi:hypothetical protein
MAESGKCAKELTAIHSTTTSLNASSSWSSCPSRPLALIRINPAANVPEKQSPAPVVSTTLDRSLPDGMDIVLASDVAEDRVELSELEWLLILPGRYDKNTPSAPSVQAILTSPPNNPSNLVAKPRTSLSSLWDGPGPTASTNAAISSLLTMSQVTAFHGTAASSDRDGMGEGFQMAVTPRE